MVQQNKTPDGLVRRTAQKAYKCAGNGAIGSKRAFSSGHREIAIGDSYFECLWEAAPFQSGIRICEACAKAFFIEPWQTKG